MRDVYRIPWTRAVVLMEQCSHEPHWFVQSVYVPPTRRKQGLGTLLLGMVCADADVLGVTLVLAVQPQGGRHSLTYGELVRWYEKHGFVATDDNLMMRRPNGGNDGLDTRSNDGERHRRNSNMTRRATNMTRRATNATSQQRRC
jgi:ribosomal protein S18 acetylase RimI-like enzyme